MILAIALNTFLMHWVVAPSVAMVLIWLVALAYQKPKRVWKFVDRDEIFYYVSRSEAEAREIHIALYVEHDYRPAVFFCVGPVQRDHLITIEDAGPHGETVTKSALLWAKDNTGLIGSTER